AGRGPRRARGRGAGVCAWEAPFRCNRPIGLLSGSELTTASLALVRGPHLGRGERPDLAFDVPVLAVDRDEAPGHLDRLLHRGRLEDRVAADHFLALDERAVGDGDLPVLAADPLALARGREARGAHERAGAGHFLDQLAHLLHEALVGFLAGGFVDADHRKESHGVLLYSTSSLSRARESPQPR